MRPLPLLLFAVSAVHVQAQFPAIFNILKAFGMTSKLECALPCILDSANKVPNSEKGAAYTICTNVDAIAEDVIPCTSKCGSTTANDFVVDLTRWVCKLGKMTGDAPAEEAPKEVPAKEAPVVEEKKEEPAQEPEVAEPKKGKPKTAKPKAGKPKTAKPKAAEGDGHKEL